MATAVLEPEEPITSVHIDGLALLKIIKHCHESLPTMVTGSLLGLAIGNGILEITHAFPFPDSKDTTTSSSTDKTDPTTEDGTTPTTTTSSPEEDGTALLDGHEFQLEMMKMLREVNVDNNCIGWYQSMYLGSYSNTNLLENQFSYQTDLSSNAVVVLYDPMQTSHGELVLRCYRLTDDIIRMKTTGGGNNNGFIDPKNIFKELPVTLTNPGLVQALLFDVAHGGLLSPSPPTTGIDGTIMMSGSSSNNNTTTDTTFDRLDLSTNPYLEKHLEFLCHWVDELASEQLKFQYYSKSLSRSIASTTTTTSSSDRNRKRGTGMIVRDEETRLALEEGWASSDAPRRLDSLLMTNQIRTYCDQVDTFAGGGFSKLFLAGGLHKDDDDKNNKNKNNIMEKKDGNEE